VTGPDDAVTVIGIVSPGAMGSALGRAWVVGGARVVATVAGRSERTRRLADGLELLPTLPDVVAAADLVVSVCPPAAAGAVVDDVLAAAVATRCSPIVADVNAVAPQIVRRLAARAWPVGIEFVDGAVSGGPPVPGGDTMLYLSGSRAPWLADLPADGLRRRVVGPDVGTASAVKMCTASVYKGTKAVWIQALETAHRLGVLDVVLDDLREELPGEVDSAARTFATAVSKSGRFVAEMEAVAATQGSVGASPELFAGMAAVYDRLSRTPLAALTPEEARDVRDLEEVLRRITTRPGVT
jgi:3-hydroxyisobutyrate dehydrogenase-like beta-hydroxyacid dehydrogenase